MDYREMLRIAGDPATVRGTARMIGEVLGDSLTGWERDFLAKLERFSVGGILIPVVSRSHDIGAHAKPPGRQLRDGP
ncbi:MAG: hypothetical protein AB7O44_12550 [Hyphomicrobiaceae bacterium]